MSLTKKAARLSYNFFCNKVAFHICRTIHSNMRFNVTDNEITAYGVIYSGDGMEFVSLLSQMERAHQAITVKLHTDGGSVFDGNLIYNALRNSKAQIEIHIVGIAASMGAIIALSRDDVYMAENGFLMLHEASGYTSGTIADHQSAINLLKSIKDNFTKKLVARTGKTKDVVIADYLTGDNWLDAEQALEAGLISGIIDPEADTDTFDPQQLGRQEVFNRFAALLSTTPEESRSDIPTSSGSGAAKRFISKSNTTMKKPLIEALGLTGVSENSSDTAVIDAVRQHYAAENTALKTERDAFKQKFDALNAQIQADQQKAVKDLLDTAQSEGRFSADKRAVYEGIAQANGLEALKTVLAGSPARPSLAGSIQPSGANTPIGIPTDRTGWDWDKWQKEDPRGLEALQAENQEAFDVLFNAKYKK